MKHTTDFIVGNTAIQIVEKGNHIKVIDVEEHREKIKDAIDRHIAAGQHYALLFGEKEVN